MNLTFYVVVIAFIFALFYLCSREPSDEDELPSTVDDCDQRTPSCTIDMQQHPQAHHHLNPQQQPSSQSHASLILRPQADHPGSQLVPQNMCPPSYEQVISNEDFYSMNKTKQQQQQQHLH